MKKQKAIESVWLAKTLSVILAVLILVAMYLVPTSAAELTTYGASASTVAHSVNAEFTATIPAYVMPGEPGEVSADYTVTLENAVIPDNHELTAKVEYSGSMTEQNGVELPYELTDVTGNTIASGSKILTKAAGTPGESVSVSFGAMLTDKAKYAGVYTDTAVFTFNVTEKTYTLKEINANDHLYAIGKTKPEYVVAKFNEDYSAVTIFKNGNNSDGIMKNFSYSTSLATYSTSLSSALILNDVTSIGDYAFYGCDSLADIVIPESVTSIGIAAFYSCQSLTSVHIPDNVTRIFPNTFYRCKSLTSINIPDNVTSIDANAFYGCGALTEILIPKSVTSIKSKAFSNCSALTSIDIPESVTSIDSNAFESCTALTSVRLPQNITSIDYDVFNFCKSLTNINIPDSVTSIKSGAFSDCSALTSVDIPESVTSIGTRAFYGCKSLTHIYIPESVTSIGSNAFIYSGLKTIYGIAGSYAETFAAENGYTFIAQ